MPRGRSTKPAPSTGRGDRDTKQPYFIGPKKQCVCPNCGHTIAKESKEEDCTQLKCPVCGHEMRQGE